MINKSRIAEFYRYIKYNLASRKLHVYLDQNGIYWKIDPRNALDAELALGHGYGDHFLKILQQVENMGGTAIDIGANAGYWTLPLSRQFDKVVSLEPDPHNFQKLSRNLELNLKLAPKVIPLNSAAGSKTGKLLLSVRRSIDDDGHLNTGMSSFLANTNVVETLEVTVETLDSLVDDLQLKNVNLIKIDVEGFEHNVLLGALKTLESENPIVHWEASFVIDAQIGHGYVKECFELLTSLGFQNFAITSDGQFQRLESFTDLQSLNQDLNVLSMKRNNKYLNLIQTNDPYAN